jgi:hypothetical protein
MCGKMLAELNMQSQPDALLACDLRKRAFAGLTFMNSLFANDGSQVSELD